MKSHYKTEAEWQADYDAIERARDRVPVNEGNGNSSLTKHRNGSVTMVDGQRNRQPLPITRKEITGKGVVHSTPIAITRRSK
jgi:hypothetical protein